MTKTDFDAKLSSLNKRVTTNKGKHLFVENELKRLKAFDLSYFICKSHFEDNSIPNYLVFQPLNKYFNIITNTKYVLSWQSKGLSDETIWWPPTYAKNLNPLTDYVGDKIRLKFRGSCLKQPKISYTHGAIVNIYIVYELGASVSYDSNPTLENCLFGAVTSTRNS